MQIVSQLYPSEVAIVSFVLVLDTHHGYCECFYHVRGDIDHDRRYFTRRVVLSLHRQIGGKCKMSYTHSKMTS